MQEVKAQMQISVTAYLHWQFLCHAGDTEVSAYGITADNDPWFIESLWVPEQECTMATTKPAPGQMGELFDWAVDNNIAPQRVCKVWLHTHPGGSATPSGVDEETFRSSFEIDNWAVMGILAREGSATYCRVKHKMYNNVFTSYLRPIVCDMASIGKLTAQKDALKVDFDKWRSDYEAKVKKQTYTSMFSYHHHHGYQGGGFGSGYGHGHGYDYIGRRSSREETRMSSHGTSYGQVNQNSTERAVKTAGDLADKLAAVKSKRAFKKTREQIKQLLRGPVFNAWLAVTHPGKKLDGMSRDHLLILLEEFISDKSQTEVVEALDKAVYEDEADLAASYVAVTEQNSTTTADSKASDGKDLKEYYDAYYDNLYCGD